MVLELDAKEYALLRMALADLINKCRESKEALTVTQTKNLDVFQRYEENEKAALNLYNKLT
jgi:hypothetical protein